MTTMECGWVLTGTDPFSDSYHPTFTGNGYLGARVPAAGQGFSESPVLTQFQIAGFYGVREPFQVRASAPAWTGMPFSDVGGCFDDAFTDIGAREQLKDYSQSLDLRNGSLRTSARWASPSGVTYALTYTVIADRADDRRALVRLEVTSDADAAVVVGDVIDARPATMVEHISAERDGDAATITAHVTLHGTDITATIHSHLAGSGTVQPRDVSHLPEGSAAQQRRASLRAGELAVFTKVVGISADADGAAQSRAAVDAVLSSGIGPVLEAHNAAWAELWRGDIRIDGDRLLQEQVRASRFYLLASVNADRPFSLSPAGLSSDGYGGHVFWDTETWMWPSLVLQDPDIAASVLQYRADRVDDARIAAERGGDRGIRFPWEGGLDGFEHTPAIEFGETELHIISDVALACWQYYLATGDTEWLQHTGAPIIAGAADFWCGRAIADANGTLHLQNVTPPDEWAQAHDDSAYTNVAAARVAQIALRVAGLLGSEASPEWQNLAENVYVPYSEAREVTLEHADYDGARIKQADVVMLTYPWEHPQDDALTARNLDYYASKVTEHGGPSMTDAMHSIVSAELGRSRDAFWYTKRSADPFLRAPFQQFAEESDGGAFTFVTGAGGFLQEFLYGYSGLRLREDGIWLRPLLPTELEGITLQGLKYRRTAYSVAMKAEATTIAVADGPTLRVHTEAGVIDIASGGSATIPTRASVDADACRGFGTHVLDVSQDAVLGSTNEPTGLFSEADFDLIRLEAFEDGDLTRFVATVAGEIANPWAAEAMSAHGLQVYLTAPQPAASSGAFAAGVTGEAPHPWNLVLIGSGLEQGAPTGTGVYDAEGNLLADARLTVARRSEIVLTIATTALQGTDLTAGPIFAALLDNSGGHTDHESAPGGPVVPRLIRTLAAS